MQVWVILLAAHAAAASACWCSMQGMMPSHPTVCVLYCQERMRSYLLRQFSHLSRIRGGSGDLHPKLDACSLSNSVCDKEDIVDATQVEVKAGELITNIENSTKQLLDKLKLETDEEGNPLSKNEIKRRLKAHEKELKKMSQNKTSTGKSLVNMRRLL
eukprot:752689-Hanusia_phi.AAC.2